jgi:hypothetical protein
MNESFPRLLVAAEFPPNAPGGGPAVVRQMLRGWPVEQLFWWSCLPERDQKFGRRVAGQAVASIPEKLYPHRRWCGPKSWLLENIWTPWAARHFKRTLKNFQPEAVWVIPHNWAIPPLAAVLPQPGLGFHTTVQDYMDTAASSARFGIRRSRGWVALADRLYATATTRDATSHPMIADLLARTRQSAVQMLHAGIEQEDLAELEKSVPAVQNQIRIAYAGTILVEREFALFAGALTAIRAQLPARVSLEFFGNHSYRRQPWFEPGWMTEHGNLPEAPLMEALRNCTWGFAPMALTDEDPRYNRFSFPTKFINYLAAGLPVISLGHPESSVVKMARAYQVGVCITASEVREIGDQLAAVLAEPAPKSAHQAAIRRCVLTEFDASRMRATLLACFQKCAAVTRGGG